MLSTVQSTNLSRLSKSATLSTARHGHLRPQRRSLFGIFGSKASKVDQKPAVSEQKPHVHGPHCNHGPEGHSKPSSPPPSSQQPHQGAKLPILSKLHNVKHLIAVSSGKGGVGKSTVAVNLALALSQLEKRVGLLDADIYGPSIPTMMNLVTDRPKLTDKNKIIPLVNYGIECMSMGFLVPQDTATIWRGPMVMSALDQMLHEVEWGNLDILVIDLPPGTGDAQLTLTQRTPLSGAIIVSTPQEVALADVRRGANMFRKVDVPILGLVENMAYFEPPCGCNKKYYIFGEGGARKTAQAMDIEFLGEIPIDQSIRELCDAGKPSVAAQPDSPSSNIYRTIAQRILSKLQQEPAPKGPTITIEE